VEDTWFSRDLPVLESLVRGVDKMRSNGEFPTLRRAAEDTGLTPDEVLDAAHALSEAGYVVLGGGFAGVDSGGFFATAVSADARREVGAWPTADNLAQRLLDSIQAQADDATTPPERRSVARKVLDAVGTAGRGAAQEVISVAICLSHPMRPLS
jgi:hypothetical protein